ncbi:MAG: type II toxin-antitoxin system RelE/ParE family toxin [Bacteroides sp.]|nr:type II toxin-antitoxin system RelE/ParE family toxin [Prevotella sp.]MCM1407002.1 type II toxin-antitoxin system RelE/ParE family toxin [Treponema brennaborense]MCM1470153.1 type II toxin-antitoxin system RelE/ParE family toxin [Bacteroides sp.]
MERSEPLKAAFFKTEKDNQPCRDFILSLSQDDKREVGAKIFEVQKGFPMGLPLVRKIGADLWEIRTDISDGICRIFFTIMNETMILLHGFVKKSQKIPQNELKAAESRLKQFKEMNK